jgi:hypothetical protein
MSCDIADWLRVPAALSGARRAEPKEPNDVLPLRLAALSVLLLEGLLLAVLLFCDENPLLNEPELLAGRVSAYAPFMASVIDKSSAIVVRRDFFIAPTSKLND